MRATVPIATGAFKVREDRLCRRGVAMGEADVDQLAPCLPPASQLGVALDLHRLIVGNGGGVSAISTAWIRREPLENHKATLPDWPKPEIALQERLRTSGSKRVLNSPGACYVPNPFRFAQ